MDAFSYSRYVFFFWRFIMSQLLNNWISWCCCQKGVFFIICIVCITICKIYDLNRLSYSFMNWAMKGANDVTNQMDIWERHLQLNATCIIHVSQPPKRMPRGDFNVLEPFLILTVLVFPSGRLLLMYQCRARHSITPFLFSHRYVLANSLP